jgi:hypothetical protein
VFENRVLRRIFFVPKGNEVTGCWRKLHNEELHNVYSSPSIIRMMKSKGMRWAGHVAQMGRRRRRRRRRRSSSKRRRRMHMGYWWESQKERDHLEV